MNQRGFTFIELIVVISIMGILMAFAAPSLVTWQEQAQLRQVTRDIFSGMRQARSMAITTNQEVNFVLDPAAHKFTYGTTQVALEEHVALQVMDYNATPHNWNGDSTDGTTTFYPNGSCSNLVQVKVADNDNLIVSINSTTSGLAMLP